jgi:hypothetical protein
MPLQILGQVTDIQTTNPVEDAQIVIVEPGSTEVLASTTTTIGTAGPGGYFTFDFTFEQMNALLGGHHHKTITFKVYDEDTVFLGSQDALISALTFTGTETFAIEVDASYTPPSEGLLFAVSGKVVEVDGSPISGLDVNVYHKKLASEDPLETEQTAADGRFLVRYEGPAGSHPDHALITIQVRAYDGETLVASSGHICNPRHDLTLLLVRDDEDLRGPPALVAFMAGLAPHLDEVEYHELTADQVHYLACKTGYDATTIATIARAHQLSEALSIDVEAFYGLAHAGFPLSTSAVLGLDADTVEAALLGAIADNAIPATVEANIATITAALAAARVDRAVPTSSPETTTLGSVLVAASLTAGLPRSFAEAYLSHTGTVQEFWTALRNDIDFGDTVVDTIQFTLQAAALTASHVPLVKLLNQKRDLAEFSRAAELAQFTEQDWIDMLDEEVDSADVSTPAGIPGGDETARRANYGRAISRMIEDLYPSAHVAYHLPVGVATSDVADFVIQNPGFSFQRTSIDEFLETAEGVPGDPGEKETLRQDLFKVQRIFNVAPRFGRTAAVGTLLDEGIVSARQIQSMGAAAFKATYSTALGGEAIAESIYESADQVATTALATFTLVRPEFHFPAMKVFTTPGCGDPDLEAIFGSLDYCECRHCDSVHGPAAYFVDIMNFLRHRPAVGGTVMDKLVARRPELMHIKLNCENAETPLPTIDLVNEVLERAVLAHHSVNPHTDPATWPQTTWTAADLAAHPEKVYTAVYDTYLIDDEEACFPWALPFDLGLEEARIYLTHLGISRIALQDTFEWFAGVGEDELFRVNERLGLSPAQAAVVRRTNVAVDLWELWGFSSEGTWVDDMNVVETFLERSELSFEGLQALLRTDLFSDVQILFDEPCKLKDAEFRLISVPEDPGITAALLEKLVTVYRVGRTLGWPCFEVDMVMRGLGLTFAQPVGDDLETLAHFVRVRRQFPKLPLGEVLSWWAPLDTRAPAEGVFSFYEEVVRPNTREAAFQIDQIDTSGLSLDDVKGSLLGILQVDEASLAVALAATGLTGASDLTRDNLSKIYRVASIARATSLRVSELVTLVNYRQSLKEASPAVFAGQAASPIRDLLEVAAELRASGFSGSALDYVLRDREPERFGASDADVTRALVALISALQASDADHEASMPPADLPALDRLEKLLARLYDGADLTNSLGLINKTIPEDASQGQAEAARDALFPFLSTTGDAYTELGKAFADVEAASAEERAALVLPELAAHLRRLARERTAVQKLATLLDIEPADASALVGAPQTWLATLTADDFVDAFDPAGDAADLKNEDFPDAFLARPAIEEPADLYRTLRKIALVLRTFRFEAGLLRWLLANASEAPVDILDLTDLPASDATDSVIYTAYSGWDWLRRAILLRDEVLGAPEDLVGLLGLIFAGSFDKPETLAALATSAGWDAETLTAFETPLTLAQATFQSLEAPEALAKAFATSRRVGVDPATLLGWAKDTATTAQAAEIKGAAQAKYSPKAWPSVAKPLRDRLREQQRDALAQYLVPRLSGVGDRDDLFTRFLMDPEVSACPKTSRLLFATAAVQLFVQRALMGLEDDVTLSDEDSDAWVWMKRYRVWEANRKIFLYPENWVTPELRDDKSPLFRKLEEELSQSTISEASVEKAYIHYLEGLHEIARLEICGLYHEIERDSVTHEIVVDKLHVFGRVLGDPSKVFYRQRIDDSIWTAWEELPFQVESPDVIPVVANRRLMLLWPKIEFKAIPVGAQKVPKTGESSGQSKQFREIRMMFAERESSEWSGVRTSNGAIRHREPEDEVSVTPDQVQEWQLNRELFFTTSVNKASQKLTVYVGYWFGTDDKNEGTITYSQTFSYDACRGDFVVSDAPEKNKYTVYNTGGLDNAFPMPRFMYVDYQGFRESPSFYDIEQLQLPFRDPVTHLFEYPYVVIDTPSQFRAIFARQDNTLRPSRPFVVRDDVATLFIRELDETSTTGISGVDQSEAEQSPAELGTKTMTPYVGLDLESDPVNQQAAEFPQLEQILSGGENAASQQQSGLGKGGPKYRVSVHYHPYVCLFLEQVRRHGVEGLLDPRGSDAVAQLKYQTISNSLEPRYVPEPNLSIVKPYPIEDIDFTLPGAYSVYNWELFYHIPMYIADRLMAERQYAAAQKWLHYIFNPNRTGTEIDETDCKFYWQIRPFREAAAHVSIDDLLELLHYTGDDGELIAKREDLEAQIAESRKHPFSPHGVARMRPTAYMRAVVMKYLDNLIAWGDDLFRQDTLESNNEATLYYAMALQILGKRPRKLDARERPDYTLDEALDENDGFIDDFSNFLVELENKIIAPKKAKAMIPVDSEAQAALQKASPSTYQLGYVTPTQESGPLSSPPKRKGRTSPPPVTPFPNRVPAPTDIDLVRNELYFCIPPNAKLLSYWDTVADRLFKLRNCLNLDGIRRELPLFEPPIDPALLAKAAAQGVDIGTAISVLNAPLPHYRFMSHLGVAKELAGQVASLGGALLQALEKRDAEALAILRAGQEVEMLASVRKVKETALREASANIEALTQGRRVAEERLQYYRSREAISSLEAMELDERRAAAAKAREGGDLAQLASAVALIPDLTFGTSGYAGTPVFTFSVGGSFASRVINIKAQEKQLQASDMQSAASVTGTYASYARRREEWEFQARLAERDIAQIDRQITAAEIRRALAELEVQNHDQQAADSAEVLEYMQSKFTNVELYAWMSGEVSKLYFQAYNLAADLARRAQRCYQHELAVDASEADFIAFGHWDNRRKGLLAGERLAQDLRRMETAYYEKNRREYELTKRVSLASLDPVALVALRKTGACHFFLPETIFDLDHPSHYMRRLKMVSVSVPAVTGPYTSIGATLTYESGAIRREAKTSINIEEQIAASVQTIAISVGQDDTGLFEPNLRDERYLPFEGKGVAHSSWRLELPAKVRTFDYETISDVILTIRYTAREGGSVFGGDVQDALPTALQALERADGDVEAEKGEGQVRLFSARAEFPEAWRAFVAAGTGGGAAELELELSEDRFPRPEEPKEREIDFIAAFVRFRPDAIPTLNTDLDGALLNGPGVTDAGLGWATYKPDAPSSYPNYVWFAATSTLTSEPGTFTLSVDTGWPSGKEPEDILLLVQYKLN